MYLNALKALAGAKLPWQACQELHTCIHLPFNICDPLCQQLLVNSPCAALRMTAGTQWLHRHRPFKELLKEA